MELQTRRLHLMLTVKQPSLEYRPECPDQYRIPRLLQLLAIAFEKTVENFYFRVCKEEILWTPSHIRIERNRRADKVAK